MNETKRTGARTKRAKRDSLDAVVVGVLGVLRFRFMVLRESNFRLEVERRRTIVADGGGFDRCC